ncbi:MAG: hypothetical protein AMXMBFR13_48870 [Phycisphaerae bacterium]
MLDWLKAKPRLTGSVLFRGTMPPRAEEFSYLREKGIALARGKTNERGWELILSHPSWGKVSLVGMKSYTPPPSMIIEYDASLSPEERETVRSARTGILLGMKGTHEHVLRDRKMFLRFLHAIMGEDGVGVVDHIAQRIWSREALEEELGHDADLDIEQIMALHAVRTGKNEVDWLHSHGLAEIGAFDFDILRPSSHVRSLSGADLLRALAFAIAEGSVDASTSRYTLASPGGVVRLVEISRFNSLATSDLVAIRDSGGDEAHNRNRAVLCDPPGRLWGRWSRRVRPSSFLSGPLNDGLVMNFSNDATHLMSERARGTYCLFRSLAEELAEFELPCIVKLGYPVDGGHPTDREHLWFEVHKTCADCVDATLINAPHAIDRMKAGQRGRHPVEYLSDWSIMTPLGSISPRQTVAARRIRANKEKFREFMARIANRPANLSGTA